MSDTEILTHCDICDAPITEDDLGDGATVGGWDHPLYGAVPAECSTCWDQRTAPMRYRKR